MNPEVAFLELSPEQLQGSGQCSSKPEYRKVILPALRQLGSELVPIQPSTSLGEDIEQESMEIMNKYTSDPEKSAILRYIETHERSLTEEILKCLDVQGGFLRLQDPQIAECMFSSKFASIKDHLPEYFTLWQKWNLLMMAHCQRRLSASEFHSAALFVGLGHLPYFRATFDDLGLTTQHADCL